VAKVLIGNLDERESWEDPNTDGKIILKFKSVNLTHLAQDMD
jgi:hypothetical protein